MQICSDQRALHFAPRDRLVYAVRAASVKHGRVPRVHSQSIYRQLAEPGVHLEPVITSIQALEDATSYASHIERLRVCGIDNYRGAPTHCEFGKAGVDG